VLGSFAGMVPAVPLKSTEMRHRIIAVTCIVCMVSIVCIMAYENHRGDLHSVYGEYSVYYGL
jgi:hypothetical protein